MPRQYYDEETGLHYNRFRYYDPSIGRYISADPIGQDGGANLFAYSFIDPVNLVDPFGLIGSRGFFGRSGTLRSAGERGAQAAIVSGAASAGLTAAASSAAAAGVPGGATAAAIGSIGINATIGFVAGGVAFAATDALSGEIAAATGIDPQTALGDLAFHLFGDSGDEDTDDPCEGDED